MGNYIEKSIGFTYPLLRLFDNKILSLFSVCNSYLLAIDNNFFRNFFLTIGASFLGILAIVFSLSLFSIQYASENNSPRIFKRFLEDKKYKFVYLSIGTMAIILFLFALLSVEKDLLLVKLFFVFAFLIFLLILLYYHYCNVAQSVNPLYIIGSLKSDTISNLSTIDKNLKKGIEKVATVKKIEKEKEKNEIKTALIANTKNLFGNVWTNIQEIFDLTLRNSKKNNYDVTWQGFSAIYEIIKKYLFVRKGTFVDLSLFSIIGIGSTQDFILVQTYEKLFAIQRVANSNKDLQLSKDLLRALTLIAKETLGVKFLNETYQSNSVFDLTYGYTFQIAKEGINEGFYDLGVDISNYYSALSGSIISNGSRQSLITISRNLSEIATVGIIKKQFFIIDYTIGTIGKFIQDLALSEHFERATFNLMLDEAKKVIIYYVTFNSASSGLDSNLDVQNSLGRFVDLTRPYSIGITIASLCQAIIQEKNEKKKDGLINNLMDINNELWLAFDYILKISSKTSSFINYFIGSNIGHICKNLASLYEVGNLQDRDKKELLNDIRWHLSDFWRMMSYKDKDFENINLFNIEEDLLILGYKFLNLGLEEETKNINEVLFSMGRIVLEKGKDSYGFTAPRIVMTACKLAIYSKGCKKCQDISGDLIKKIASDFYPAYIAKFNWQKDIFSKELSELDPFDAKYNGSHIMFEDRLISEMKEENIEAFITDLEKALTIISKEEKTIKAK